MTRRSKIWAFAAALSVVAAFGISQSKFATKAIAQGILNLTTLVGTEQIPLWYPCTVSCYITTAQMAGYGRSTGLLYATQATAGSANSTPAQTLASYTLPANTLVAGTTLRIKASFTALNNGDTKFFGCYFGSEGVTSGNLTTNNKNGSCEVMVTAWASPSVQM